MRETILSKLKPVRRRQLLVAVIKGLLRGLLVGGFVALLIGILRLAQLRNVTAFGGMSVLISVPLLSAIAAGLWSVIKTDWRIVARAVDQSYELKDRTETALAFLNRQDARKGNELEELQLADAVHHLQKVEPKKVVPFEMPASSRWAPAIAVLALVPLCWPTVSSQVSAGPSQPIDAIVTEAEIVEEDLQALLDQLPEDHDPEIDALIKELQAKANEMKEPGVDVREALAKMSEMQTALQAVAAQFNVAATDEQMKAIGEALQSAEALQQAGQALQDGQYEKGAEELAKLEDPKLDRKESRAVSEKLQKASEKSAQNGLKKLSEATKELSEGMKNDNQAQSKSGISKLAESAKKQGNAKKISDMLKKQCDKLGGVSEAIFGRTPPPPPPNVEPLEPTPNNKPKATIRMQLEAHATHSICASCHQKIDPLGFAFDNFDAIGQWRTEEIVPAGQGANPPVNATGQLPDGRTFNGSDEFKNLLVQDVDRFAEAFVEQLATFALRRVMTIDDAAAIKAIAQSSKKDEYRLRTMIENFVMSEMFQKR